LKQARLYHQMDQEQCKYCYACNKYVTAITCTQLLTDITYPQELELWAHGIL
jgi:hypothetical protein